MGVGERTLSRPQRHGDAAPRRAFNTRGISRAINNCHHNRDGDVCRRRWNRSRRTRANEEEREPRALRPKTLCGPGSGVI